MAHSTKIPKTSRPLATILSPRFGAYPMPWPKNPGGYTGTVSTFVDSGRNLEGYVIGSVVRDDVGKCEFQYSGLSFKTIHEILRLFSRRQGGSYFNRIEYYAIEMGDWVTKEMYVSGDRISDILRLEGKTGKPDLCQNFRIAFIER